MTVLPALQRLPGLASMTDRYASFSLRERLLVLGALLAVTWMCWSLLLGDRLDSEAAARERANAALERQLQAAVTLRAELEAQLAQNPNSRLETERERLQARLTALEAELVALLGGFVPPTAMPQLLEDMLSRQDGLQLVSLESLPVEPVLLADLAAEPGAAAGPTGSEEPAPTLHRHPVRLEFEGEYFAVLAYLQALEAGPWKLGWRRLDYRVEAHPLARVVVEFETLSEERSWLGV